MKKSRSFYRKALDDKQAVYLDSYSDRFILKNGKIFDITLAIQKAITDLKEANNYGIVFIPEGTYYINKTIYIPKAIRLIGYGEKRPMIILEKDSPGFQKDSLEEEGRANYMFWFTDKLSQPGEDIQDANPGTFYSAMSNIDLKIEDGNPAAVALRTHYAQHSFVSHMNIYINNAKAGIHDAGNTIEDIYFFGGDYGIYTAKASPGWPILILDTYFEGQKRAAINTKEAGLTIIRMIVKNLPRAIETEANYFEKLYMEDCQFFNISNSAFLISNEYNAHTQVNLRNIFCTNVPFLLKFRQSKKEFKGSAKYYQVEYFIHGQQIHDLGSKAEIETRYKLNSLADDFSPLINKDFPQLPDMDDWVNLKSLGAKGDGETDDTEIMRKAIEDHSVTQYWSLWVCNGGGGIFKNIWTASPYASAGLYVSDTSTKGRIYLMSVEHHVRKEVKFKNVSNWQVYALQLEEEYAESSNCQPLELINCQNMIFANTYFFRVIWVSNNYPYAIKSWDCKGIKFYNIHNYSQTKYTITNTLLDVNSGEEVRPWEIAYLSIDANKANNTGKGRNPIEYFLDGDSKQVFLKKVASGFDFADGICSDSKGNVYFCDSGNKEIYKWSEKDSSLSLLIDIHFKPLSLACDQDDNLLIIVEYLPPEGATINGKLEKYTTPDDALGSSYAYWYNTGSTTKVYAIDSENPENTMEVIEPISMESMGKVNQILYPTNRWRDSNDYYDVTIRKNEKVYLAPDGRTIIPLNYDLLRANSLLAAYPGEDFYAIDEYNKRTVRFAVSKEGYLSEPEPFVEKGEFGLTKDSRGNMYIADGDIYVYNQEGLLQKEISINERPVCIKIVNINKDILFITTRHSLYKLEI
ncbi:MAG: glycosyl hydrolase family 28-related protein [bacterium]